MARDPLSVGRNGLVAQARDLVVWLRAWEGAEAALARVGAGDLLEQINSLATQADAANGVIARKKLRSPYVTAERLLVPIRDWAVEVRALLRRPGRPDALTREVRALVSDGFHRVSGSASVLRTTLPRLEALVAVRGEGRELVDRGSELLAQLAAGQEDHDRWDAERAAAAAAASEAAEALRGALRELRHLWRLARHRSGGALPALPLHLARSLTARKRSETEEDEDETEEDGSETEDDEGESEEKKC